MSFALKRNIPFLLLFLLFSGIFFGVTSKNAMAASEPQKIFDDANLLSSEEIDQLEELADKYSEKRGVNIFVSTVDSDDVLDIEQYSDEFVEQHPGNTVVLSINMATRKVDICSSEQIRKKLEVERCTLIREKITPDLSDGDYYSAFRTYIKKAYRYLGVNPSINPESIFLKTWFQALIALGIGGAAVGIMAYQSGGSITVNQNTYLDTAHSRLVNKQDNYIRTVTTKTRKPESNSSSGGGGGGSGGGGNAHSSGSF